MAKRRIRAGRRRLRRYIAIVPGVLLLTSIALTLPWRWITPPTSSFILQERFRQQGTVHQQWVPLAGISPALAIAVVAAEDQKFPQHHGFDFRSISQALREERRNMRGANTISQQLAKNLYLWPGRSLVRK